MDESLSNLVEKSGYKQRFIAAYADMSESKFSRILKGEAEPSLTEARKIAELLSRAHAREIPVDEIFPPQRQPVTPIPAIS